VKNPLRHQLASTSPIALSGLVGALGTLGGKRSDPRATLVDAIREAYSVADVRLCRSGTHALLLALHAAERLLDAPPVAAWPAFSCYDLASAAVRFGRPVRFYDVDPNTLGPDPESLAAVLDGGADVVVTASLFGIPIDWSTPGSILERSGALVIEDAAQGHGARWRGERLGGHGRLGVLSFARGKGWTGGGGGALLVRDSSDANVIGGMPVRRSAAVDEAGVLLRGMAHWALGRPGAYGIPRILPGTGLGETRYCEVGQPAAMPAAAAHLILDSQGAADARVPGRRSVAEEYAAALDGLDGVRRVSVPPGAEAGYIRFPVVVSAGMASFADPRKAVELGAAPSYPRPLPDLEPLSGLITDQPDDCRGARTLARQLVTLPTHELTTPAERAELVELLVGSRGRRPASLRR
jgi:dTDP-4-amino-4,6-dideoxygalactose transaminase